MLRAALLLPAAAALTASVEAAIRRTFPKLPGRSAIGAVPEFCTSGRRSTRGRARPYLRLSLTFVNDVEEMAALGE